MSASTAAEATDPLLASSCLDFLLIELVPLSFRLSRAQPSRGHDPSSSDEASSRSGPPPHRAASSSAAGAVPPRRLDDDDQLEAVHLRLDSVGYRVGQGLVERFSRDRPRFNETLDVIKFLCKDLWSLLFGKNIDNLKTNHRGVYVLTDNLFRPFSRMSTEAGGQAVVRAQPFLWFPCGIVRGALAALGIKATVQAEISQLPTAVFQIKTLSTKP